MKTRTWIGAFDGKFEAMVASHGVRLVRIFPTPQQLVVTREQDDKKTDAPGLEQ